MIEEDHRVYIEQSKIHSLSCHCTSTYYWPKMASRLLPPPKDDVVLQF
jgi:hypothetical protein